jgi:outer membrane protein OmpA-like peptidoglycan-associated protein
MKHLLTAVLIIVTMMTAVGQHGLRAEFYDGDNFDRLVTTQKVSQIKLAWHGTPPVAGIRADKCSIKWYGQLVTSETGEYSFAAQVDDGIRVWVDDVMVINQWGLNDLGIFEGTAYLEAGQQYDLRVEYFNALLEGEVELLWSLPRKEEDYSWYEQLFGVSKDYVTIPTGNYLLPTEVEEEPTPAPAATPKPTAREQSKPMQQPKAKQQSPKPPARETSDIAPSQTIVTKQVAEKYIPKNVQFVHTKAEIEGESYGDLDIFAAFLVRNPQLSVKIEGHTDVVGNARDNMSLSADRAAVVAKYLVSKGVSGRRLSTQGYGGTQPLKVPKKGEYYAANRRVVFVLDGLD